MSRTRIPRAFCALELVLFVSLAGELAAEPVRVKMADGSLPKPAAIAFASGSGVIVGKRLVLTNRHIARDEKDKYFDGFKIYTGPDYKKPVQAKVIAICENYDLALLQTSDDLPAKKLMVLDDLPPLSEHVIAYGFPLGSRFGVSLTTTGGQVARHPVAASRGDDESESGVKQALWHDAALTGGNSGGPLFTTSKLLVGINFAYLKTNSNQALAVPSNVVADFLRSTKSDKEVNFAKVGETDAGGADPQAMTVFIESMINDVTGRSPDLTNASSMTDMLVASLKTRLPAVSPTEFKKVEAGELHRAYPPLKIAAIEPGEVSRVRGDMTIRALRDEGMFVSIDGVLCLVVLPPGEADEVRTRLAKNPNPKGPIDQLYFVGPPATLRVSDGTSAFALVLLPLKEFADSKDFKMLLEEEKTRRETQRTTEGDPETQKSVARYEAVLRHKFTDASGRFQIDAVPIKVTLQSVDLVRLPEKQRLTVSLDKISADDRTWLRNNEKWVSLYGKRLEDFYLPAAAAGKK